MKTGDDIYQEKNRNAKFDLIRNRKSFGFSQKAKIPKIESQLGVVALQMSLGMKQHAG